MVFEAERLGYPLNDKVVLERVLAPSQLEIKTNVKRRNSLPYGQPRSDARTREPVSGKVSCVPKAWMFGDNWHLQALCDHV